MGFDHERPWKVEARCASWAIRLTSCVNINPDNALGSSRRYRDRSIEMASQY